MIDSGEKLEEYREIKPYWNKVFGTEQVLIKRKLYNPEDVEIIFSNGYAKNRRQIHCDLIDINHCFIRFIFN